METTGGDVLWINVINERHNIRIHKRSIHNMLIAGLLEKNEHAKKLWCAAET